MFKEAVLHGQIHLGIAVAKSVNYPSTLSALEPIIVARHDRAGSLAQGASFTSWAISVIHFPVDCECGAAKQPRMALAVGSGLGKAADPRNRARVVLDERFHAVKSAGSITSTFGIGTTNLHPQSLTWRIWVIISVFKFQGKIRR